MAYQYEAGFIGAGNMGGALAQAAAKSGAGMLLSNRTADKAVRLAAELGCAAGTNLEVAEGCKYIFLGVKPQMVVGVVESLKADILASEGIFVSMLAGVSLEKLALLLGAALGYLNGFVLTSSGAMTQAEVLFITYGMSSVFMAIGLLFTNAETLRLMRATKPITIFETLSSTVGIVPVIVIVFVVLLAVMHIFLNKTLAGRSVTLLGGNKDAAYLCGFNTKRAMRMVYAINGLFAAMGAIALVSRVTTATATCGTGYETNAILCVVVGMNLLGLSTYMQSIMRGAVLVVAIWLDNRREL